MLIVTVGCGATRDHAMRQCLERAETVCVYGLIETYEGRPKDKRGR